MLTNTTPTLRRAGECKRAKQAFARVPAGTGDYAAGHVRCVTLATKRARGARPTHRGTDSGRPQRSCGNNRNRSTTRGGDHAMGGERGACPPGVGELHAADAERLRPGHVARPVVEKDNV